MHVLVPDISTEGVVIPDIGALLHFWPYLKYTYALIWVLWEKSKKKSLNINIEGNILHLITR